MAGILDISGDEYWLDIESDHPALAPLKGETFALDAPPVASLDRRESLPVHFVYIRSLAEAQRVFPEQTLILVAVRLEDNRFWTDLALRVDKEPAEDPFIPPEPPNKGLLVEVLSTDARDQLELPWEQGTVALTGALRNQLTNTCTSTLGAEPTDFVDEAVEQYVRERARARPPIDQAPIWPPLAQIRGAITRVLEGGPAPFPNYRQHQESPPVPEGCGVALQADRVTESGPGRRCVLRGSFRLPCTVFERVTFDPQTGRRRDVGAPGATAVVQLHVLVTGAREAGPFVMTLRVPSFDEVSMEEDSIVTGFFNIDLFELGAMPQVPDTYFLSVFSREVVAGPVPIGIAPPLPT